MKLETRNQMQTLRTIFFFHLFARRKPKRKFSNKNYPLIFNDKVSETLPVLTLTRCVIENLDALKNYFSYRCVSVSLSRTVGCKYEIPLEYNRHVGFCSRMLT